jgi:alpha,alpha-trehalose phosphorylase
VIASDVFEVEPWTLTERELHLDVLAQTESIFALSNGHIGLRGNLDEGEPMGTAGTYLNSFYETQPLPYAELAYGNPEDGQVLLNVTNGKVFRLLVDDEPFDVRYGRLERHERTLDLRDGVLRREVEWESPAGQRIVVRSTRLVSFVTVRSRRSCTRSKRLAAPRGSAFSPSSWPTSPRRPSPTIPGRRRRWSPLWCPSRTHPTASGSA